MTSDAAWKTGRDQRNLILIYLAFCLLTVIPVWTLHQAGTTDEFGTMANAAWLAGYDWSEALYLASGNYYKYGTAVFYALPYMLIRDAVLRYRVIMTVTGLLMSLMAPAAYYIARVHLKVKKESTALILSAAAAGNPAAILQGGYARADWALIVLPWLILIGILGAYRAENPGRKILFTVFASFLSVYAFMCHTRGVVLTIAFFMTIFFVRILFGVRAVHLPAAFVSGAAALALDRILTPFFKQNVWGDYEILHGTMEVFSFSSLKPVLTLSGFKVLVKILIGWCFSIFTSTCGILLIGILAALLLIIGRLRKMCGAPYGDAELILSVFAVLQFAGSMALGILFFYSHILDTFNGVLKRRTDRVIYERYMAGTLGVLCLIGLCFLIRRELVTVKAQIISVLAASAVLGLSALYVLPLLDRYMSDKKMFMSIYGPVAGIRPLSKALTVSGAAGLAVFVVLLLMFHFRAKAVSLAVLIVSFAVLISTGWISVRAKSDRSIYRKLEGVLSCLPRLTEVADEYPLLYKGKGTTDLKIVQPVFCEFRPLSRKAPGVEDTPDMLMLVKGALKNPENWENLYEFEDMTYKAKSNQMVLYAKGEGLRAALEAEGFRLKSAEGS